MKSYISIIALSLKHEHKDYVRFISNKIEHFNTGILENLTYGKYLDEHDVLYVLVFDKRNKKLLEIISTKKKRSLV